MSFQYPTGQPPQPKQGLNPILLIVGGLIALVVIGGIVVLAVVLLTGQTPTTPAQTVSFDVPTARDGYPTAITMARQNDAAAALANVAGAWLPAITMAQLEAGRTGWTYFIYLPATRQMAAIVVDRTGSARIASTQKWETPPDVLDDTGWTIDSPTAMAGFLQKCRADLLASPDRQVEARLSTARSEGRLTWHYAVLSPGQAAPVCEASVDAATGQVK